MKLRFRVGRKQASKEGRKNGDIEALADAMRALKNRMRRLTFRLVGFQDVITLENLPYSLPTN